MHKFVCVAFSNVLFIFCFVFFCFFLFSLLQAKSKNSGPTSKDIKAYEEQTNFSKVELKKVIAAFDKEANKVFFFFFFSFFYFCSEFFFVGAKDGVLDREAWKRVLVRLEEAGVKKNLASDPFADDLYSLVDANGDGFVDKSELLSGLSLTCKGSPQQKMDLMFQLWDANGDGRLDQGELTNCFHKCYRSACLILLRKNPKAETLTKVSTQSDFQVV